MPTSISAVAAAFDVAVAVCAALAAALDVATLVGSAPALLGEAGLLRILLLQILAGLLALRLAAAALPIC